MKKNSCKHNPDLHPESWKRVSTFPSEVQPVAQAILGWLPDEYLFSLVVRNHTYWGYPSPAQTIEVLFGKRMERADFLGMDAVEILVARTQGRLGSPLEIFENHTLLRFYQVFMRQKERERYFTVRQDFSAQLKFPMALWNGNFTTNHPLRACASCIEEDEANFGMPYWHLQHQYPGACICLKHQTVLQQTLVTPSSLQRFLFHTPVLASLAPPPAIHKQSKKTFWELALIIQNLTADIQAGIAALESFRNRFVTFVADSGLLAPTGGLLVFDKVQVQSLCESFVQATKQLSLVNDYNGVSTSTYSVHHTLSSYIKGKRSIYVMEQIALVFWFRTLPFWTEEDELEWVS